MEKSGDRTAGGESLGKRADFHDLGGLHVMLIIDVLRDRGMRKEEKGNVGTHQDTSCALVRVR